MKSLAYRPKIPVWVGVGDGRRTPFYGLLDTGADDFKLTFSQADRLGVTLDRRYPIVFRGVRSPTFGYSWDGLSETWRAHGCRSTSGS